MCPRTRDHWGVYLRHASVQRGQCLVQRRLILKLIICVTGLISTLPLLVPILRTCIWVTSRSVRSLVRRFWGTWKSNTKPLLSKKLLFHTMGFQHTLIQNSKGTNTKLFWSKRKSTGGFEKFKWNVYRVKSKDFRIFTWLCIFKHIILWTRCAKGPERSLYVKCNVNRELFLNGIGWTVMGVSQLRHPCPQSTHWVVLLKWQARVYCVE
jgi:hypothetical protein